MYISFDILFAAASSESSLGSLTFSRDSQQSITELNSPPGSSSISPGVYARGRERWRSSGTFHTPPPRKDSVDYSATPFSQRPKVSPVVNPTPDWFVEEPAIVLDDANMIEYRVHLTIILYNILWILYSLRLRECSVRPSAPFESLRREHLFLQH